MTRRRSLSKVLPLLLLPLTARASVFDAPEPVVTPAPSQPAQIRLTDGVRVIDSDVSPIAPAAALLVAAPDGAQQVLLWNIGQLQATKVFDVPAGFKSVLMEQTDQNRGTQRRGAYPPR